MMANDAVELDLIGPARPGCIPWGVYVLGNDSVLEFAIALFRSLRVHSPSVPIRLIPYDEHLSKLRPWMERYNISLVERQDFSVFNQMGEAIWGFSNQGHAMFRKLACFEGEFERFLYLDIDIAILAPVERLFEQFVASDADIMTFDNDVDNVYRPGPWRDSLVEQGRTKGFNAGAFLARRGLVHREALPDWTARAQKERDRFVFQFDQPFFNFLVDMAGWRQVRLTEFNSDYPDKVWGDQQPTEHDRGSWRLAMPGHPDCGKTLPMIHWAGHSGGDPFPNRRIFYHYRLLGEPWWKHLTYRLTDRWRWWIARPGGRLVAWIRHKGMRAAMKLGYLART
jgi:hypothetical protein